MNVGESFRTGFVEIWGHKTRSFLSFSSIAFGVAAILYTFANVNRMYERRAKTFELAGPGRLHINQKRVPGNSAEKSLSKGLTTADADAIRQALPWLFMVSPKTETWVDFSDGPVKSNVRVMGITPEWRKRGWVYRTRGRFIDAGDLARAARVAVVIEPGGWVEKPFWARWWKEDAFGGHAKRADLLGRTVRIANGVYTIVGVLRDPPRDKDPRWFDRTWGSTVLVPLTAAQRYVAEAGDNKSYDSVEEIVVDTGNADTVARARRRIEALLNGRHRGVADFEVEDFRQMIQNQMEEMRKTAMSVLAVGLVAILAGGVGIMNVTLATIFSRIREIGVRRALGATRADILIQFLTEATLLGLLGGLAGIGLGMAGLKYLVAKDSKETIEALLWWHFPTTLAISIGTALVFAAYPAYQASRLDPVEALRYE